MINLIDDNTLVAVFGDHGMTDLGDHGGDSKLELDTLLFFYSKKSLFKNVSQTVEIIEKFFLTNVY